MTYMDEWKEAISQILSEARELLGLEPKERPLSESQERAPYPTAGHDQLLLPGIAEPHRWEFGPADRGQGG